MIEVEVESTLRELTPDLSGAMQRVADLMGTSVRLNFTTGGRPVRWQPLKSGAETPLVGSGALYRSVRTEFGSDYALVAAGAGLPYARIHQTGGQTHPKVTPQSKKFFWAMFHETGDEKWKWMALQRVGETMTVNIPPRPYMLLQDVDIEAIKKIITQHFWIEANFGGGMVA